MTFEEALSMLLPPGSVVRYVANKGNAGDALIAAATDQVFSRCGIFEGPSRTKFVAGGGALVPWFNCLARAINRLDRDSRVVIGPSTVSAHWEILKSFPNLVLMAREDVTYGLARMHGINVLKVHDAAFSFDYGLFSGIERKGKLIAMRGDCERSGAILEGNRDLSAEAAGEWTLKGSLATANRFVGTIAGFEEMETNRAHGAIAGGKLGLQVKFSAGSYFKNRAIFESSMTGMQNVTFE